MHNWKNVSVGRKWQQIKGILGTVLRPRMYC